MEVPKDATTVSLVVGSMTLVGVLVGAAITNRVNYLLAVRKEAADTRNWRRDRALEAYSEFTRLVNAITVEAGNVYIAECGTVESAKHREKLFEKLAELYHTHDRVILLASLELQMPITAIMRQVTQAIVTKSIQCPKAPDAEVKAEGEKLATLNTDFTFKARSDLGVHPIREKV